MRILFWNVEHFSQDKFFSRKRKRSRDDDEDYGAPAGPPYFNILYNAITANNPDVIIIIEARLGAYGAVGTLPVDRGAISVLRRLRALHSVQWALVPPLISGTGRTAEVIAIFYRRTGTFYFTGPGIWPGGAGPVGSPGAAVAPGDYPAPYRTAFSSPRSNRLVPAGNNLYNAGAMERQLGGQVNWSAAPGGGMMGPAAPISFGAPQYRTPFRVTFYDSAAGRNYNVIAFHAPPMPRNYVGAANASPPVVGVQTAATLAEVQQANANETTIFCGDFNVDLFDGAATAAAYGPVTGGGWTQVVNTTGGAVLPGGFPNRGYLMTHMCPVHQATPADTNGYPAFGYLENSLDNAFVHGAAVNNPTVANLVTGAPYNAVALPANMPGGHYAYASALTDATSLNSPNGINPNAMNYDDEEINFRSIDNYSRIRGVSDHIAIVFDC